MSEEEYESIKTKLGLEKDVLKNLVEDKSIVYKGKRYAHGNVKGAGIVFSISTP